uniref:Uncharacterized protein n=1 Tax=Oryza brachyantha TaxID=4533 RepID=J3LXD2_ORYBR
MGASGGNSEEEVMGGACGDGGEEEDGVVIVARRIGGGGDRGEGIWEEVEVKGIGGGNNKGEGDRGGSIVITTHQKIGLPTCTSSGIRAFVARFYIVESCVALSSRVAGLRVFYPVITCFTISSEEDRASPPHGASNIHQKEKNNMIKMPSPSLTNEKKKADASTLSEEGMNDNSMEKIMRYVKRTIWKNRGRFSVKKGRMMNKVDLHRYHNSPKDWATPVHIMKGIGGFGNKDEGYGCCGGEGNGASDVVGKRVRLRG